MSKKFILTDETKKWFGYTLHRIKAVKDFGYIRAGDLGGWVEGEENLSQDGTCWIYDNAYVYGYAKVSCDARICDNAQIHGSGKVSGSAIVKDSAVVTGMAHVTGSSVVKDSAAVTGGATVSGCAHISAYAIISGATEQEQNKILKATEKRINELKQQIEQIRKETVKEILILLGKGFDETKMTEFKNLPWYKLFCRELKQKYGVDYHDYI